MIYAEHCATMNHCAVRLTWLGVTNALALLRLLPVSNEDKDAEILTLRHQITIPERQPHGEKGSVHPADRGAARRPATPAAR